MSMEARGPQRGCRMTSMWPSLIREIGQMFKPLPECRGPALGDMREAFVISFNTRARSKAVFAPFGDRQLKRHAHGTLRKIGKPAWRATGDKHVMIRGVGVHLKTNK